MAIVVPTRTAGSLGTTKSDQTAPTNEPQQLLASQYNVCADKLIEVIDQSNASAQTTIVETLGASGSSITIDVSGLPSADHDLELFFSGNVSAEGAAIIRFNGDAAGNYTTKYSRISGNAISGSGLDGSNVNQFRGPNLTGGGAGVSNTFQFYALVPEYAGTVNLKRIQGIGTFNRALSGMYHELWGGYHQTLTAAVTTVTLVAENGTLDAGAIIRATAIPRG